MMFIIKFLYFSTLYILFFINFYYFRFLSN